MIRLTKETRTYNFGPENPPAIKVDPGTTIVFETLDALDDQIHSNDDPANKVDLNHVNAATGPVYIHGAKPGDTVVAEILDIRPWAWGAALIIPGFGFLQDTLPGPFTRVVQMEKDGSMQFGDKVRLPSKPMIGTIGVSPTEIDYNAELGRPRRQPGYYRYPAGIQIVPARAGRRRPFWRGRCACHHG